MRVERWLNLLCLWLVAFRAPAGWGLGVGGLVRPCVWPGLRGTLLGPEGTHALLVGVCVFFGLVSGPACLPYRLLFAGWWWVCVGWSGCCLRIV